MVLFHHDSGSRTGGSQHLHWDRLEELGQTGFSYLGKSGVQGGFRVVLNLREVKGDFACSAIMAIQSHFKGRFLMVSDISPLIHFNIVGEPEANLKTLTPLSKQS